ncbi:uncharacterized protein [Antennarius striatus]|uniref:uncharacterized protein isoform X2 n=1 Tax=Antennarius striatus TaxID=241820 RepID=UPI0035B36F42
MSQISRKPLDTVFQPHVTPTKTDVQLLPLSPEEVPSRQQNWSPSLDQEEPPELPHIKEEQEKLWPNLEEERLHGLVETEITQFTFSPVSVNGEEEEPQASQFDHAEDMKNKSDGKNHGGQEPNGEFNPGVKLSGLDNTRLHTEDVQLLWFSPEEVPPQQQDQSPSLDQDNLPKFPHIKEEQEELWTGPEEEGLQGPEEAEITQFRFSPVSVKDEEEDRQTSQLHHAEDMKNESDGEECGEPEPDGDLNPDSPLEKDNDEETSLSSEPATDDSHDWEPRRPSSDLSPRTNEKGSECHAGKAVKLFTCSVCERKYSWRNSLMIHMRLHTEGKSFHCSVCQKVYPRRGDVERHMRVHTGEKPFACSVCGTGFARNSTLKEHMRTHTGDKPFSCPVCGLRFTQSSILTTHLRIHTGEKPYSCSICHTSFSFRGTLSKHMRKHSADKPFRCSICGAVFTRRSALTKHGKLHSQQGLFVCSVCNASFSFRSSLVQHMRIHTG